MLEVAEEKRFHSKKVSLDPSDVIVYDNGERDISSALIRQSLDKGLSVMACGPYASYPVLIDSSISYMRFTADMLEQVIRPPWIRGLSPSAIGSMDKVLRTSMRAPSMRGSGILMGDPMDRQCYYEVCFQTPRQHGRKDAELFPEALFSALLTQYLTHEGVRTMLIFLEIPYRPKSRECYQKLMTAEAEGLRIVRVCRKGREEILPEGRYPIRVDEEGRFFTERNKKQQYLHIT